MTYASRFLFCLLALLLPAALAESTSAAPPQATPETGAETGAETIADILAADPRFSMLVEALDAAGLLTALEQDGPFTLFAPTDDAFMLLGEDELDNLINDPEALARLLRYHVAEGVFLYEDANATGEATGDGKEDFQDLAEVTELVTLESEPLFVTRDEGGELFVGEARIVEAGVRAGNGVVYAIDTVLLPPADDPDHQARLGALASL